jgi:hypothetical protein
MQRKAKHAKKSQTSGKIVRNKRQPAEWRGLVARGSIVRTTIGATKTASPAASRVGVICLGAVPLHMAGFVAGEADGRFAAIARQMAFGAAAVAGARAGRETAVTREVAGLVAPIARTV